MGDTRDLYKMEQQTKKNSFLKFTGFFAAGAILAVAIYMVYEKFFKEKEVLKLDTKPVDYTKTLKIGVIAPKEVMFLQEYLNSKADKTTPKSILPLLKVDGIFGSKTQERLFEFMKKNETTISAAMKYGTQNNVTNMVSVLPPKSVM